MTIRNAALPLACLLAACGAQAPANAAIETTHERAAEPEVVATLPLQRGFYVRDGETCAQASNVNLVLHHGKGINTGPQAHCTFIRIERGQDGHYTATERCTELQGGTHEDNRLQLVVLSDTRFRSTNEFDWTYEAQHCPQPQLPEPWRSNDISDILGG